MTNNKEHASQQSPQTIDEMYAFVATDESGDEGIIAFMSGDRWIPMVGADMERVASLRPLAQETCDAMGREVRVMHFTNREVTDTLTPQPEQEKKVD